MKTTIKNRKELDMVVEVEEQAGAPGLVFVMHGLSGTKEQPHVQRFADAFRNKGFGVVLFDTTNSFGESGGVYEDVTVTTSLHDLEDVIAWSSKQSWYQEPFWLIGHSLGGMCVTLFAEAHAKKVYALAPIAPVVSGQLSLEAKEQMNPASITVWKETGWLEEVSESRSIVKRLPWSHMEDRCRYDVLTQAHKLTMPVLLVVGDSDDGGTRLLHMEQLYAALPSETKKALQIIKGAPHTYVEQKHLDAVQQTVEAWIDSVLNS